jgi:hypothetical protein
VDARPTPDGKTRGLAAVARFADIDKSLATWRALGVDPHILDQEGLALWTQSLDELPPAAGAAEAPRVVVYEGADRATLVVGRGAEFLGAHGMRQFNADQASRLLRTYFESPPPALRWIWTGSAAAAAARVKAQHAALSATWPGPLAIASEPEAFLARALACRALLGGPLRCNLRGGRSLHPALARRRQREPLVAAAACLVAGLLLCGVNIAWRNACERRDARIQAALTAVAREITPRPQKGMELLDARRAMEARTALLRPLLDAADGSLVATLKSVLAAAREADVRYEVVALRHDAATLHGVSTNWAQCEQLKQRVAVLGLNVRLARKEDLKNGDIAFVISTGVGSE